MDTKWSIFWLRLRLLRMLSSRTVMGTSSMPASGSMLHARMLLLRHAAKKPDRTPCCQAPSPCCCCMPFSLPAAGAVALLTLENEGLRARLPALDVAACCRCCVCHGWLGVAAVTLRLQFSCH